MRLPHNAIRQWWHQPVLDRLDAIEAALRLPQIAVKGVRPEGVRVETGGMSATELAKAIAWEVRAKRRRDPLPTFSERGEWKHSPPAGRQAR